MQDLTLTSARPPLSISRSIACDQFFVVNSLGLVLLNILTCGWHLTGSNLLNTLSYAVAVLLIGYSVYVALVPEASDDTRPYKIVLAIATLLVGIHCLFNYGSFGIPDCLKYLSVYTFYVAGRNATGPLRTTEKRCIYALAILPFIFKLAGETKIYIGSDFPDVFSYFPNTNTAALYFAAVCFCLSIWLGSIVILLQFLNAVLMNRVGPAVATIAAIGVWSVYPVTRQVLFAIPVLVVGAGIAYAVGALDRMLTGVSNMIFIMSLEPAALVRLTYKQLAQMTGTSDLSAFFRIIHWTNMWDLYTTQGLGVILFGYGAGQTSSLTFMPVPPHNDYLRILAEYGVFSFLIFVCFVVRIVTLIRLRAARILFTVLLIYFISENLIDNFTSMALFFSYAGRLTCKRSSIALAQSK